SAMQAGGLHSYRIRSTLLQSARVACVFVPDALPAVSFLAAAYREKGPGIRSEGSRPGIPPLATDEQMATRPIQRAVARFGLRSAVLDGTARRAASGCRCGVPQGVLRSWSNR